MDLVERVRARAELLRGARGRAAPTASLQILVRAGAWSDPSAGERLARLCLAAAEALGADPLFAARRTARLRVQAPAEPVLWVGPDGGRTWLRLGRAELGAGCQALAARLSAGDPRAEATAPAGLEILDLSTLGALEWRGALLGGAQGRLCLLAARPAPSGAQEAFGLALDFDAAWCEAGRAARFLAAVATALGAERVGCGPRS
ncbi:MAG TPA: hypothetical protein PK668_25220 [Myxococcota bacterium]|nr:hypothetical protein [Myxococcota bacterium]HRY95276.1 hypothetical protein [Myxococcota bacterium]HSA22189.1 hypothetical protein [Myxococcota bacterium]